MRPAVRCLLITVAVVVSGWLGWTIRAYWPPAGGYVQAEGPEVAERLRNNPDLDCVERWAAEAARTEPVVKGGSEVADTHWPDCVRRLPAQRVLVMEDRRTVFFLRGTWRLVFRPDVVLGNTCWRITSQSCVTYTER